MDTATSWRWNSSHSPRPTTAAEEGARLLARTEGILVDPIYTAKALAGLVARVRDGGQRGPVVFWHAGGLPGLFERP